jgi:hypothetical protein
MEAAGSLITAFVEAGVSDGGDDADGADGVKAPAVVVSTWGGESSSMGSVGVALRGNVGVEGGWSELVFGVLSGVVACRAADGREAWADSDSGERDSSFSSSCSRSNSSSFWRRLVFLAGGGCFSGKGGVGGAGGGVGRANGGGSAAAGGSEGAGSSHAVVAARLRLRIRRRRQRRLPATVSVTAGAGMLHKTVKTWHLAAWLMLTLAFRPLATQR